MEQAQNKKNFVKPGYLPEDAPDCHPDEMALRKQIRNKNKKLGNIQELEDKLAGNPDMELNDEQKSKIASKKTIRKEIDDVIKQIKDFQKKQAVIDAEFEAKTKDAIAAAVQNAVQAVTNMVVLCTISNESPDSVPENLRDRVQAYNKELKKALNTNEIHADFEWKKALASFSKASLAVAQDGKDLAAATGNNSTIANVIVSVNKEPEAVDQAINDEPEPQPHAETVEEETQAEAEETKEPVAEQAEGDEAAEDAKESNFERRRGGNRGGRGGRGGRPRTAKTGEDDEGFKMTNEGGERRGGRGRGRGFGRGGRGRGGFEGDEGAPRGGRGGPRGGRGGRKPRGGAPEDGAPSTAPADTTPAGN